MGELFVRHPPFPPPLPQVTRSKMNVIDLDILTENPERLVYRPRDLQKVRRFPQFVEAGGERRLVEVPPSQDRRVALLEDSQ